MNIYNNIALRSLNQVKTLNPIMYISIRCFFEDFSTSSAGNGLFSDFIERKLKVRKDWSTKQNKLFKKRKILILYIEIYYLYLPLVLFVNLTYSE